jgi:hypothetical protein
MLQHRMFTINNTLRKPNKLIKQWLIAENLPITAPKTYAGGIKAFANKAASRKTIILLCKCVET